MLFGRTSGILLHPTSLPASFGIGDLGSQAYRFVDFLVNSGQQLWQILPLGPTGWGNSPYMCFSAFAGNPLLISPEGLAEAGWLHPADWESRPEWPILTQAFAGLVDYDTVIPFKQALLQQAWQRFLATADPAQKQEFHQFCQQEASWLEEYALFAALKDAYEGQEWVKWSDPLVQRDPAALEQARRDHAAAIAEHQFQQFLFAQQWFALKAYANQYGIKIIGDIPIYVAHNSADVWANQSIFKLDPHGDPLLVAGVPPDYFSATGQRWGNPLYDWEGLKEQQYDWWIRRMRQMMHLVDCVRIDHFRGFDSYWAIPAEEETAVHGEWLPGPGADLFEVLQQHLGQITVIAEDLGDITPAVLQLRDRFNFPGMKILEFAFGSGADNPYLPHNYERNCVVYTGTHDNNTAVGWFYSPQMPPYERDSLQRYLGCQAQTGIHWDLIRLAMASVADTAIIPLQDAMGLAEDSRMNLPGTSENNWRWRYSPEMLRQDLVQRLAEITLIYGRISPASLDKRRHQLWIDQHPEELEGVEPEQESDLATAASD